MEFSACHLLCLGWNPGTWSLSLPSPNNLTCPPIPCPSWAHSQVNQMLEFAFIDVAGNLHYKVMSSPMWRKQHGLLHPSDCKLQPVQ